MTIVMIMASSINGLITNGDDPIPSGWTSKEGHAFFDTAVTSCEVFVIGRNTFEIDPEYFAKLPVKVAVMTGETSPEVLTKLPPNVRFFNASPEALVTELDKSRVQRILIAGGAGVNRSFLAANLVDSLYLTLEPILFGSGLPLTAPGAFTIDMKLTSVKMANPQGTLFLAYKRAKQPKKT